MAFESPYLRLMRLHQPTGIWLLLWPCWWAAALASHGLPPPLVLALLGLGAVAMRSAGCVINDIVDRRFDREVERTRMRPLASGELGLPEAFALLAALMLAALGIAYLLGLAVIAWSLPALALIAIYPFMKRITWWPQLFLGITFNWGALAGWVAVRGEPGWAACLLYAAGVFWTLGYDTIYAHQDKIDDARIGVKSTALRLAHRTTLFVSLCYAAMLLLLAGAGLLAQAGPLFYSGLFVAAWSLARQVITVELNAPFSCRQAFASNAQLGGIIFAAIVLSGIFDVFLRWISPS